MHKETTRTYIFIDGSWMYKVLEGIRIDIAKKALGLDKKKLTKPQYEQLKEETKKDPLNERNIDWTSFLEYINELSPLDGKLIKAYVFKPKGIQPWVQYGQEQEPPWRQALTENYRKQLAFYDAIARQHARLEVEKVGYLKVNSKTKSYKGEKGLDLGLAMRIIGLLHDEQLEQVMLVSGDGDYMPLFDYIKYKYPAVTRFVVVFNAGEPPRSVSSTSSLGDAAGNVINIYEHEGKGQKGLRDFLKPEESQNP